MDKLFLDKPATTRKAVKEYALKLEPGHVEREQLYQSLRLRQDVSNLQQTVEQLGRTVEQLDNVLAKIYERLD